MTLTWKAEICCVINFGMNLSPMIYVNIVHQKFYHYSFKTLNLKRLLCTSIHGYVNAYVFVFLAPF